MYITDGCPTNVDFSVINMANFMSTLTAKGDMSSNKLLWIFLLTSDWIFLLTHHWEKLQEQGHQ